MLPLVADLLDLLSLLLLLGLVFVDFLDLRLVLILIFILVVLIVSDLLLLSLLSIQLDGEANKLGMLLHEILDALLLQVLAHILFQVEGNASTTSHISIIGLGDSEATSSLGGPSMALIIVVLGYDLDLIGNQVGRVETHTELTNHGNISSSGQCLHESLGTGLSDGTEIVDEVSLGHSDSAILDGQGVVGLVGNELDLHIRIGLEDGRVGKGLVANLVEGIGGV
mmetsp:Transcript_15219/g.22480  ORF Transcript_15219/g.22480 Transcript_15219/m.22480 type:complete len:225 (+) Transcript_15219:1436-2110(+)